MREREGGRGRENSDNSLETHWQWCHLNAQFKLVSYLGYCWDCNLCIYRLISYQQYRKQILLFSNLCIYSSAAACPPLFQRQFSLQPLYMITSQTLWLTVHLVLYILRSRGPAQLYITLLTTRETSSSSHWNVSNATTMIAWFPGAPMVDWLSDLSW